MDIRKKSNVAISEATKLNQNKQLNKIGFYFLYLCGRHFVGAFVITSTSQTLEIVHTHLHFFKYTYTGKQGMEKVEARGNSGGGRRVPDTGGKKGSTKESKNLIEEFRLTFFFFFF